MQINMYYGYSTVIPKTDTPSDFSNIHIQNITGAGANIAVELRGLPEHRLKNITLEDIRLRAERAMVCSDVENIALRNVDVYAAASKDTEIINVNGLRIENFNVH